MQGYSLAQKMVGRACGYPEGKGVPPGQYCEPKMTTVGSQDTTGPMTRDELKDLACLGFMADLTMQSFWYSVPTARCPTATDHGHRLPFCLSACLSASLISRAETHHPISPPPIQAVSLRFCITLLWYRLQPHRRLPQAGRRGDARHAAGLHHEPRRCVAPPGRRHHPLVAEPHAAARHGELSQTASRVTSLCLLPGAGVPD